MDFQLRLWSAFFGDKPKYDPDLFRADSAALRVLLEAKHFLA